MKVLVVDDDEGSRRLLRDLLSLESAECIEAANGEAALKNMSPEINLCITDIHLPDIDGYEIARQIKAKYPQVPIIAYTASVSKIERVQLEHSDLFSAVLLKPIQLKDFNEVICKFLVCSTGDKP